MALTSDRELFELFENEEIDDSNIERIVVASLKIKKSVVEADERECGIRKILNFGHTLGHGIEAIEGMSGLYHGECVALGMIPMVSPAVYERLLPVLKKLSLPTEYSGDLLGALSLVCHDKKCDGARVSVIFVDKLGEYRIDKIDISEFEKIVLNAKGRLVK
jgi:3-dehydroquinate synthase